MKNNLNKNIFLTVPTITPLPVSRLPYNVRQFVLRSAIISAEIKLKDFSFTELNTHSILGPRDYTLS